MRRSLAFVILLCQMIPASASAAPLEGVIFDAATNQPVAARLYLTDSSGKFFHVQCKDGTALPYDIRRGDRSFEIHTTVSAHPFQADVPPGEYTVVVEKGKEYFSESRTVTVTGDEMEPIVVSLRQWTDMAARGWYSGETHVHREVGQLPTLQVAEDVNVAFPLTAWVTDSEHTPAANNKSRRGVPPAKLIEVDAKHVFWPVNTEYEIFTVKGKQHTLGAVFILNHREQFEISTPPVGPVAAEARRQGGFLELGKHNWPWSMMLVPQMRVDLFELANNHMWKTDFLFADWYPEYTGRFMQIEMENGRFTERGWIDFGFQNYYALLNCGFRMKPTAGTASGVHPVPFGFGRVYVKLDGDFNYNKWVTGLLAGNSFVTTGPMLVVTAQGIANDRVHVRGELDSVNSPQSLEVIVNGEVVSSIDPQPVRTDVGAFRVHFETTLTLEGPSWVAVRAFTKRPNGRVRFAHTAPVYFEAPGKALRPTRSQRDYLVKRVSDEMLRNRGVISEQAMSEYANALQAFQSLAVAE